MNDDTPDHYAALGLDRSCTLAQIRTAYRLLSKRHHPDLHPDDADAVTRAQELNAAHEVLSNPARRRAYDRELRAGEAPAFQKSPTRIERNVSHEIRLRIEDFFRGATIDVTVNDPGNPDGVESYRLEIPPETAPGERFRISRAGTFAGGFVIVRARVMPSARFKVRGADLRYDLRISGSRAAQGGSEMITGPDGALLRVEIPRGVARGAIVRVHGQGMPKPRGGRGDMLVRITYRVDVRTTRGSSRW